MLPKRRPENTLTFEPIFIGVGDDRRHDGFEVAALGQARGNQDV